LSGREEYDDEEVDGEKLDVYEGTIDQLVEKRTQVEEQPAGD